MSISEIIVILAVALIVIGPKKLPDVAKSVGKGYAEFRRTFNEFKKSVDITADIKSSGTSSSQKNTASTYKSRWEEQIVKDEAPAVAEAPEKTETAEEEKKETAAPERAKRGDLVKEDNNVNNG